jgi:uracil phosphoribosyltransferase
VQRLTLLRAGGSLCACLDALISRGAEVSSIRVVGAVAAPPALKRLSETYPGARAARSKLAAFERHAPC